MRKPAYAFLRRGRKTCQMDVLRPRKPSLCHHPGPEIHPEAHKSLPASAESSFMALRIFQPRINLLRGASRFHAARPGVLVSKAPGSRSPFRGHMHSAHSSVRSGMCSPLRASLYLSAATVSPGGQARPGGRQRQAFGGAKACQVPSSIQPSSLSFLKRIVFL